jgi:hypothetical protein
MISVGGRWRPSLEAVRELDDQIRVEYSQFYLVDTDIVDLPEPRLTPAHWIDTGPNWAAFLSGGQDHYASVRMQLWKEKPTPTIETWDLTCDVSLTLASGEIRLWALTVGPSNQRLVLAGAGHYRMRVHCRGRQAAAEALDEITIYQNSLPQDIERYLIQLWRA